MYVYVGMVGYASSTDASPSVSNNNIVVVEDALVAVLDQARQATLALYSNMLQPKHGGRAQDRSCVRRALSSKPIVMPIEGCGWG